MDPINDGFVDEIKYIKVGNPKIGILGFSDTIGNSAPITNTNYIFDTTKKSYYAYDTENILIKDNTFILNTDYKYVSEIQETNFGKVSVLEIKTDDKQEIESVVIE
jgi:hypothetical protein